MPFQKGHIPWNTEIIGYTNNGSFQKGIIPWNKGRKMSDKTRNKLRLARIKNNYRGSRNPKWRGGKPKCKDCGKILSDYISKVCKPCRYKKMIGKNHQNWKGGRPKCLICSKEIGYYNTTCLECRFKIKTPTSIEKIVYDLLKNKGIIFEKQKQINNKFIVDVYIPDLNVVIECDGDYWHSREDMKRKDKAENAYLSTCGFNLIRISETEINKRNFSKLEGII